MATDPHQISNKDAIVLTKRWQQSHPGVFQGARFEQIAFDNLLAKPGATGIRIYMGEKEDGQWTYVMVATDVKNKDIFTLSSGEGGDTDTGDNDTEENPFPCPTFCDCDSPLSDCP